MKKMNLKKPQIETEFLEEGKGQKVKYLRVPDNLDLGKLKRDVQNGAKQFKECIALAERNDSQFVIIHCKNREEGYMAVSYLSAIWNNMEGSIAFRGEDEEEELEFDKNSLFADDFFDKESKLDLEDEDDHYDEEEEDWIDDSLWYETDDKIPCITYSQLAEYDSDEENFFGGPFGMVGRNHHDEPPYWTSCRNESIIIEYEIGNMRVISKSAEEKLKRFENNKHVYFLNIVPAEKGDCFVDETSSKEALLGIILSFSADVLNIDMDGEDYEQYYCNMLENWFSKYGFSFSEQVSTEDLVKKLKALREDEVTCTMEKVAKYLKKKKARENNADVQAKNSRRKTILETTDFAFLDGVQVEEKQKKKDPRKTLENELVGMESVKQQVRQIVEVAKFYEKRRQMGLMEGGYHNVHLLIGAPGTAKTTMAKLLGEMMKAEKLLSNNRFISLNGAQLKGKYVGHTAPKVHQIFEDYDVIFIDEAYSLTSEGDQDSYSQEALAQLAIELENHALDKLVMFAGYGGVDVSDQNNKMKRFIDANPGIKSRINSTIYFSTYGPEQMLEIVHNIASNQKYILTHEADESIMEYFAKRQKDESFGNGREARSLLENIVAFAATRTMGQTKKKITKTMLQQLNAEDVLAAIEKLKKEHQMQGGKEKNRLGFSQAS